MDAAGPTADPAAQLPDGLQVAEALKLYSSFYRAPADWRALMDTLGLAGQSTTRFGRLSGGQKQRLSIALALVGSPQVTVLDELTTGLDPQARRDTWDLIEDVRSRGVTIVLVAHVMEEAERLCDRVALIDAGCVVAVDTPAALAGRVQAEQRIGFRPSVPLDDALAEVAGRWSVVARHRDPGHDDRIGAAVAARSRDRAAANRAGGAGQRGPARPGDRVGLTLSIWSTRSLWTCATTARASIGAPAWRQHRGRPAGRVRPGRDAAADRRPVGNAAGRIGTGRRHGGLGLRPGRARQGRA